MADNNPFSFEKLMDACGMNPDGSPKVDNKIAIELVALRNENKMLKDELERYKNLVEEMPAAIIFQHRIPVRQGSQLACTAVRPAEQAPFFHDAHPDAGAQGDSHQQFGPGLMP